jgi:hypothetical protein
MAKQIWLDDEYGDDVVAIQHAKGASKEEEIGDYRIVQMMHKNDNRRKRMKGTPESPLSIPLQGQGQINLDRNSPY